MFELKPTREKDSAFRVRAFLIERLPATCASEDLLDLTFSYEDIFGCHAPGGHASQAIADVA